MKYLLVIAVVGFVLWLMFGRDRGARPDGTVRQKKGGKAEPVAMVACAHCGVHLPQNEAVADAAGRPYCGESHRIAGPR